MIKLENVSKRYGTFLAAKNVSFTVKKGEIIGLLGVNGAGKTTIMKMITGYHNPHAGAIEVCGYNVLENPTEVKRHIGYLPEANPLYDDLLVFEYLEFISEARGIPKLEIKDAIDRVSKQCALQDFIYKPISDLSKGMKQRVGLAQALLHDPDVLILDEPTSGLDPNQIKEIRAVIKNISKNKAIMLSTHILQEVEAMCDRVLIVNKGQIVAEGTDKEIAAKIKGEDIFKLEFVGNVPREVLESIKNVRGVKSYESLESRVQETEANLEQKIGQDAGQVQEFGHTSIDTNDVLTITAITVRSDSSILSGEVLFDWVLSKSLRLRTLQLASTSLESIFEALTSKDGSDANSNFANSNNMNNAADAKKESA